MSATIDQRNALRRRTIPADLLGTVRRSPDGRRLAVLWPAPPSPARWMVTDAWGSCGYEADSTVAAWPVVGAVPCSPAAGMALVPHAVPIEQRAMFRYWAIWTADRTTLIAHISGSELAGPDEAFASLREITGGADLAATAVAEEVDPARYSLLHEWSQLGEVARAELRPALMPGEQSPTAPAALGEWLRCWPLATILHDDHGDAWQVHEGEEIIHKSPVRVFPALVGAQDYGAKEITKGAEALEYLAGLARFTVLAVGKGAVPAGDA